jgi:hypothetical protein
MLLKTWRWSYTGPVHILAKTDGRLHVLGRVRLTGHTAINDKDEFLHWQHEHKKDHDFLRSYEAVHFTAFFVQEPEVFDPPLLFLGKCAPRMCWFSNKDMVPIPCVAVGESVPYDAEACRYYAVYPRYATLSNTGLYMVNKLTPADRHRLILFGRSWDKKTLRVATTCSGLDWAFLVVEKTVQVINTLAKVEIFVCNEHYTI